MSLSKSKTFYPICYISPVKNCIAPSQDLSAVFANKIACNAGVCLLCKRTRHEASARIIVRYSAKQHLAYLFLSFQMACNMTHRVPFFFSPCRILTLKINKTFQIYQQIDECDSDKL